MTFATEIQKIHERLKQAPIVKAERWQGVDVSAKPEMQTHELRHVFFKTLMGTEELVYFQRQVKPNLPWADRHFEFDRVCGEPVNPGTTWREWPHAHSADKFRDANGQFNHSYAERYFPKYAGPAGSDSKGTVEQNKAEAFGPHFGIRYPYGDLSDVVKQLARDPTTRQAILPIFFPEDTGAVHGGRVPCSLAYQFFLRDGKLDVSYWLRSCDFLRHFRDDIYLTIRLLLWVLAETRKLNPAFNDVKPGEYVMLMTSLHIFRNDYQILYGEPYVMGGPAE